MDNVKKYLAIFLAIFLVGTLSTAAYLDEISVLIGGNAPSQTNPLPIRISDGTNYIATLPVSVASLPLPTGASTSANQSTANTSLNNIDLGIPAALGQNTMANSMSVAISSNQSSIPVTGTFFQATQPVSAVSLPLPTGASTDRTTAAAPFSTRLTDGTSFYDARSIRALTSSDVVTANQGGAWTVTANQGGAWNITNITGTVSLPTGASTSANQTTANTSLNNIDTDTSTIATNQTNGTQKTRVTSDGTNDALVTNTVPANSAYAMAVRPISLELATYSVVSTNTVVGNNKSMIALQNTGTSVVRIREIWVINDRNTAVTGIAGLFEVRRITSFSGGTALTPAGFDTSDTLPAGITAATNSTVAGEGVLLRSGVWSTDEWGPGTADVESFDHAIQQSEPFWKQTPNGKAITIRQNQGVHVKFATNSTAGEFNIRLVFTVE